jgi:hypothetical protein
MQATLEESSVISQPATSLIVILALLLAMRAFAGDSA